MNNGKIDIPCSIYIMNDEHTIEKYHEFAQHTKMYGLEVNNDFIENSIFINNFLNEIDKITIDKHEKFSKVVTWDINGDCDKFNLDPRRVKAGRLSPEGVAYLYLGNNEVTSMKEARIHEGQSFYI